MSCQSVGLQALRRPVRPRGRFPCGPRPQRPRDALLDEQHTHASASAASRTDFSSRLTIDECQGSTPPQSGTTPAHSNLLGAATDGPRSHGATVRIRERAAPHTHRQPFHRGEDFDYVVIVTNFTQIVDKRDRSL